MTELAASIRYLLRLKELTEGLPMKETTGPIRNRLKIKELTEIRPIKRPQKPTPIRPEEELAASGATTPSVEEAFDYYAPLARVREFVDANLDEDLSLTQASRVARLSPKYFSAYFKLRTGIRFRDWIAHVRIERAKSLLAEKNRAVTRVALAVGFKDVRTFQRAFKKVTGMTPRAFKKAVAP